MIINCAVVQMNSGSDRDRNLKRASELVAEAAARGARVVALPENFSFMREDRSVSPVGEGLEGPTVAWGRRTAKEHGIYLLLGSFPEASDAEGKVSSTSVLLGPDGTVIAVYRKIHLFDVTLEGGEVHRESATIVPGSKLGIGETEFGRAGLTICYDLRFPELYRRLAGLGARLIFVPSAFTRLTGEAHWEVLLRARAIENQVFIAAPGQVGRHSKSRVTYGHSMIVDPWGTVLARIEEGEGVITAALDFNEQDSLRRAMPCHKHRVDIASLGQ